MSCAAVAAVVEHWQNVFRVTHLALGERIALALSPLAFAHGRDRASAPFTGSRLTFFRCAASLESKKVPPPADSEDQTPILPPGTMPDLLVRIPTAEANLRQGDDSVDSEA